MHAPCQQLFRVRCLTACTKRTNALEPDMESYRGRKDIRHVAPRRLEEAELSVGGQETRKRERYSPVVWSQGGVQREPGVSIYTARKHALESRELL